jgi:hypothetical protein
VPVVFPGPGQDRSGGSKEFSTSNQIDEEELIHPVDRLTPQDKNRIYFSRVVDLAVVQGLLEADPDCEIGHFAFSRHYFAGKKIDFDLQVAIRQFRQKHPEIVSERRDRQDGFFGGIVTAFSREVPSEKLRDLIILGATYGIWPTGTSFVLTYPWDLDGRGRLVRFRSDLSDFMKRRIVEILKKAGKLRDEDPFGQ